MFTAVQISVLATVAILILVLAYKGIQKRKNDRINQFLDDYAAADQNSMSHNKNNATPGSEDILSIRKVSTASLQERMAVSRNDFNSSGQQAQQRKAGAGRNQSAVAYAEPTADEYETSANASAAANNGIITLLISAPQQSAFSGNHLIQSLLAAGLRFGKDGLFHYYRDEGVDRPSALADDMHTDVQQYINQVIFSVATATQAGTFDMQAIDSMQCRGICLFMRVEESLDAADDFEQLLQGARLLSQDLNGNLTDMRGNALTSEVLDSLRAQCDGLVV